MSTPKLPCSTPLAVFGGPLPAAPAGASPPCELPPARVNGRLREYPDVRAAFEPWRRIALRAWSLREPKARASQRRPLPS